LLRKQFISIIVTNRRAEITSFFEMRASAKRTVPKLQFLKLDGEVYALNEKGHHVKCLVRAPRRDLKALARQAGMAQVVSAAREVSTSGSSSHVGGPPLPPPRPPTCTENVWIPPTSGWLAEEMDESGFAFDEMDWCGPSSEQGPYLGPHDSDFF
jgi:hypothetical protein